MNSSKLKPGNSSSLPIVEQEGTRQDAEFLSFKPANKRARARISPEPLNLDSVSGKADLFSIAPSRGWFAAVAHVGSDYKLVCSPLEDLHVAIEAATEENAQESLSPQRSLPLSTAATALTFAHRDARLLIALDSGNVLLYDAATICTAGSDLISPIHVFESTHGSVRTILPNPGDYSELVAVQRSNDVGKGDEAIELLQVDQCTVAGAWLSGGSMDCISSSVCWSQRGKQIAIGMANGTIATFAPLDSANAKTTYPAPPSLNKQAAVSVTWLNNTLFHVIYSDIKNTADADQTHFILSVDSRAGSATFTRLDNPCEPFPALRPPAPFYHVLRDWDPTKHLLVIGNSASSDIGVVAELSQWGNLSLDESAAASLPLDANMDDTVLVGFQVDLSKDAPVKHVNSEGIAVDLPAPPTLLAYLHDGTVQAWQIINSSGSKYTAHPATAPLRMQNIPSVTMSDSFSINERSETAMQDTPIATSPRATIDDMETTKDDGGTTVTNDNQGTSFGGMSLGTPLSEVDAKKPSIFGTTNESTPATTISAVKTSGVSTGFGAFGGGSSTSPFSNPSLGTGSGAFSSPSPFSVAQGPTSGSQTNTSGSQSAFGQSAFGKPAFGSSSFGSSSFGQSAFSKPSPFGQPTSAFGQSAFSSNTTTSTPPGAATSAFGSTGGGFAAFAGPGSTSLAVTASQGATAVQQSQAEPPKSQSAFSAPSPFAPAPQAATPSTTPLPSSTPASSPKASPFASTNNSFGAFGGSQSSNAFTKMSGGFGAFSSGDSAAKSSSPFFNAANAGAPKSTSAFASGTSPFAPPAAKSNTEEKTVLVSAFAPPSASTSTSTSAFAPASKFGSSGFGAPGFGKSAFASISSSKPPVSAFAPPATAGTSDAGSTTPKTSEKGGFSAFSSTTAAFGPASSSASQSFGDLLRSDKPSSDKEASTAEKRDDHTERSLRKEESLGDISNLSASYEKIDHEPDAEHGSDGEDDTRSFLSGEFSEEEDRTPSGSEEESDENDHEDGHSKGEEEDGLSDGEEPVAESGEEDANEKSEDDEPANESGDNREALSSKETTETLKLTAPISRPASTSDTPLAKASSAELSPASSPPIAESSTSIAPAIERPLSRAKGDSKPVRSSPLASGIFLSPANETESKAAPKSSLIAPEPRVPTPNNGPQPFNLLTSRASGAAKPSTALGSFAQGSTFTTQPPPFQLSGKLPSGPPPPSTSLFTSVPKTTELPFSMPPSRSPSFVSSFPPIPPVTAPTAYVPPSTMLPSSNTLPAPQPTFPKAPSLFSNPSFGPPSTNLANPTAPTAALSKAPAPRSPGLAGACEDLLSIIEADLSELGRMNQEQKTMKQTLSSDLIKGHDNTIANTRHKVETYQIVQMNFRHAIEQADRDMLKAITRKEEIVRFTKARTDEGFARMLKSRTLGPDHIEMQTQLRRDIRTIRDRVKKLQLTVDGGRKKVTAVRENRPSLKPSSYDLAFRTMGNIEQVIIRDKDEVNALSRRIAKLNLKNRGEHRGAVVNGKQPRPAQPQSSAAAVAAAALNAERSALNLKQALLSARREPLLTAASLPTPPQPEPTPQPSLQSTLPFNGPVLPSLDIPDSTFAPGDASQLGSSGLRRTSHGSGRHLKAVSLKKSTSPAPAAAPAAPPTFQWGPLPAMNNAPRSTLAFNVRAPSSSPGRP